MNKTQIEIIDGPLAGVCHELPANLVEFGMPSMIAIPVDGQRHWYRVSSWDGFYLRSETIGVQEDGCND